MHFQEGGDGMIINHNMSAHFAHRQLAGVAAQLGESIEKLSSGYKINKAGDDASGLAVSEKLRSQIKGLAQAMRNAQNGISFLQTAEGSMQEMHSILHRMRELSIQGANQIYSTEDRLQIQVEVSQLKQEIDRIVDVTSFNQLKILDGSLADLRFHIGPDKDQTISVSLDSMDTKALAVNGVDITSVASANDSLGSIDTAVNTVSKQRANVGAWQNRMGHVVNTLAVAEENLTAAESRIRDTDMAREIIEFTKSEILTQTGTAMLVQANMQSKTVLKLLG
jgi:flagellin